VREIKFRVWDLINKCFIDGYFIRGGECKPLAISFSGLLVTSFYKQPYRISDMGHGIETVDNQEEFIIQPFTGLKDKNGKEIYEGDIVKQRVISHPELPNTRSFKMEEINEIKWGNYWDGEYVEKVECWMFDISSISELIYSGGHNGWSFDYEIIGNIFENPELLCEK